jgi:hypothetical protein
VHIQASSFRRKDTGPVITGLDPVITSQLAADGRIKSGHDDQ